MNTRCFLIALLAVFLLIEVSNAQETGNGETPKHPQLRDDIEYLASEELRGRSAADETIAVAADYIAGRMDKIGLKTDLFDGAPLQKLEIPLGARAGAAADNRVEFTVEGKPQGWVAKLDEDMNPLALGSGRGEANGRVVFAGYGITAPMYDYDDYEGIDAKGATVIVLRKEPGVSDPESPFNGTRNTPHAFFANKIDNAIKHGAAALIIVNDPGSVKDAVKSQRTRIEAERSRIGKIEKQIDSLPESASNSRSNLEKSIQRVRKMIQSMEDELKRVEKGLLGIGDAGTRPANKASIPVASVARPMVNELLEAAAGRSLESIEKKIDETYKPDSQPLATATANLKVELKPTTASTGNVVGMIEGRGELAKQTVVVGAHYDHVGMGGFGSLAPGTVAVHNGADDNASGTATMLSVAQKMVQALEDQPSHRRMVFIAFTGEERGLLGSKHYVRFPRFPLDSTSAMVNLDMVGRLNDNELTVYGTGSAQSFDQLVEEANTETKFKLFKVPSGYGPSDHQSFYEAGVPVLFFFTGLHSDYHRPTDDFDKINFNGLDRITDIVSEVTFQLAIRKDSPEYQKTENRVRIRRQQTAYIGVNLSDRGDHVVLSGIAPGGPAESADLRVGDRLQKLGKREVRTSSDVLELIRNRSPGDELPIQILRDGKTIDVKVRLQPRP